MNQLKCFLLAAAALALVGCGTPSPGVNVGDGKQKEVAPGVAKADPKPASTSEMQAKSPAQPDSVPSKGSGSSGKSLEKADKAEDPAEESLRLMGVPAYPGATSQPGFYSNESSAGTTAGSTWLTVDGPDKVSDFYSKYLRLTAKSGVKRPEADSRTLVGTTKKGNKVTVSVTRPTSGDKTEIKLTVTGTRVR